MREGEETEMERKGERRGVQLLRRGD